MTEAYWVGLIVSVLLGAITILLGWIAKLATSFHHDAMTRLTELTLLVSDVARKIDEHMRDHATGKF